MFDAIHNCPEAENFLLVHPAHVMYTIAHFTFGVGILDAGFFSLVTWALYPQYIAGINAVG